MWRDAHYQLVWVYRRLAAILASHGVNRGRFWANELSLFRGLTDATDHTYHRASAGCGIEMNQDCAIDSGDPATRCFVRLGNY